MFRRKNGVGYTSGSFFQTWPGQLVGLGANPADSPGGFWEAPWRPPSVNPHHYASAGSGGSDDFPVDGTALDPRMFPPVGTGGSRIGTPGFYGLGDQYSEDLGESEAAAAEAAATAFGGPAAGIAAGAGVASGIKVITEGAGGFFSSLLSGTVFGLPKIAVYAVGAMVLYKLSRGAR